MGRPETQLIVTPFVDRIEGPAEFRAASSAQGGAVAAAELSRVETPATCCGI